MKNYQYDKINGIAIIEFSQAPTLDEGKELIDMLAKDNSYHLRLWDFSSILFDWDTTKIKEIAEYSKSKFLEDNRAAFVAPQDIAFLMLNILELHREQKKRSVVRVFRNKQDAKEWIEEQRNTLSIPQDGTHNS